MRTFYSNILVPIDFSKATVTLIRAAVSLAYPSDSVIHLVHIEKQHSLFFWRKKRDYEFLSSAADAHNFVKIMLKLLHWKNWIEEQNKEINVRIHLRKDSNPQNLIARLANKLGCQLIVMPKNLKKMKFLIRQALTPEKLDRNTKCEILVCDQGIYTTYIREHFCN